MQLIELIKTSNKSLFSNKGRSFLTILGVVIGVSAVILLVSLGKGIENYIQGQFEALGSNLVFVTPGKVNFTSDPAAFLNRNKLDDKHIDLIKREVGDYIEGVFPYVAASDTVETQNKSYYATIQGDTEEELNIGTITIKTGRFFTKADVKTNEKVALIGYEAQKELFANKNPIGERIKIGGKNFRIIGTLEKKGRNFDEVVRIPYTTMKEIFDIKNLSGLSIKIKEGEDIEKVMRRIEYTMLQDLDDDEFTVLSQQDLLSSIQNILQILTLGLAAISGISLVVGGIGIMNIMLVTVTERTKEIGLRKAVGASEKDITLQFLFESVLLSLGGGFIGITLGWLFSLIARNFIEAQVTLASIILAFTISALVGIIFGTYPAIKAAKKDPIESLRYE